MNTLDHIDTWDIDTFDDELRAKLRLAESLIRDYLTTSRRQFLEREASDHRMPHPENPHAADYIAFTEEMGRDMEHRTIRAWHYARLDDDEVSAMREGGIYPGTLDTLRRRLDAQVAAGTLSATDAADLYKASPCHDPEQQPGRLGKFWMASEPIRVDDSGVKPLLKSWGGESTHMWLKDERLKALVATIGQPRILEVAVPLAKTTHSYSAGRAVIGAFARTLGCRPDREGFDLYTQEPLEPAAILAVHTEGESKFKKVGRGYPTTFNARR
ncbi:MULTISPECIES: hypothetical protein [Bradyrhizobium]|uniref:Uncharacterized protein n=1 Tax=Bradyrhizobium ottawaense TaxID=931866 RepID=A0ABV4FJI9_9BRAD|nr:hypothetical protein [Bradyrhizobium sp. CCBAU 15615]